MAVRSRSASAIGLPAGITAGLVWGIAFLVPVVLEGWDPVIVTAGRYLAYGALSFVIFLAAGAGLRRIAGQYWRTALAFAITGNVGYYLLLVIGVQMVGAPATDVVIGCIPVALVVVGNWMVPAYRWRRLALPVALVTAGLAIVNALEIAGSGAFVQSSAGAKVAGLLAGGGADILWTWFALANARFLTDHPSVSPAAWSTIVGVATGVVTLAALPLAEATNLVAQPGTPRTSTAWLIGGAIILGVVVSWMGTWL